jgi:hypothetical protein
VEAAVTVRATAALQIRLLLAWSDRLERATGVLMRGVAGFVVGVHLPSLVDALRNHPTGAVLLSTLNALFV